METVELGKCANVNIVQLCIYLIKK